MSTIKPEAFIAIEEAMGSALTTEWARSMSDLIGQLYDLLGQRRWYAAHALIDTLDLNTVVEQSREQVEELSVSALLFGASHASGSVGTTSFTQDAKPLPQGLQQAIDQLDISLKYNIAEEMRWELHRVVTELEEQQKYAILHKEDMSQADLVTAGLATPDIGLGKQTLYVHRPLLNTAQLMEWAKAQGFSSTLEQDDFHVTVCFSREKLDWNAVPPTETEVIAIGGKREIHKFGKAIVLTFESVELQDRHEEFMDAGASFDFPDYRPHVTITYAGTDFDISGIEPYDDELVFGPEEFSPVKEDWAGTIKEQKLVKAEAMTLAQRLNAAVLENKALIDINANLTTSRLISLGFLSEAVEREITTYQVNEVLDEVTCDVCRMMHGKTFNVVQEYSKIMTALSTTDPQELRNVAPWPKNTKAGLAQLKSMSEDEMQLAGYGSPPYHPRCRGFLAKVGTVTEKTKMRSAKPSEVLDDMLTVIETPEAVETLAPILLTTDIVTDSKLRKLIASLANETDRQKVLVAYQEGGAKAARKVLTQLAAGS